VLEIFAEGLDDAEAVLPNDVPGNAADLCQEFAGELSGSLDTFLITEEGSPRHLAIATAISPMFGLRLSRKRVQLFISLIICSRRSSLF
jgi:hypothetical protein